MRFEIGGAEGLAVFIRMRAIRGVSVQQGPVAASTRITLQAVIPYDVMGTPIEEHEEGICLRRAWPPQPSASG